MSAPVLYKGSVKDLLGPVALAGVPALIFEYSDAYSVFDWGRMPDELEGKGEALAWLAARLFEQVEEPATWAEFFSTAGGRRVSDRFRKLELEKRGLKTHYLGMPAAEGGLVRTSQLSRPSRQMAVRQVHVARPGSTQVLGREVPDYSATLAVPKPRLVPLEVIFRFSLPEGSSLLERVKRDPDYLVSRGYGDYDLKGRWDFPILECFTKLESTDRGLGLSEALAISGLRGPQLDELLLRTAAVACWLSAVCATAGLELADGKLEWAEGQGGELILVDAIGPDELRLLKDGVQLSKEFLRLHYRKTPWHAAIAEAKAKAAGEGKQDWKKSAPAPQPLPPKLREAATQLYPALANALGGERFFKKAWELPQLLAALKEAARE